MVTHISRSPEETLALGEAWGRQAERGLVIGLTGELGAGKTTLVQGIARGLGLTGRVTSPSFALVNIHDQGRLPLFHLDLYRLENPEQVIAAGLEEYLDHPRGVTVVEWIERWDPRKAGVRTAQPGASDSVASGTAAGSRGVPVGQASSLAQVPPPGGSASAPRCCYRSVLMETVSETVRRISYEDTGA